jgi:uncharacterized membrane protein YfcA
LLSAMAYSLPQLLVVGLVMTCGSVLQGTIGFASGLFGVPLLVLCGFTLVEATVINFVSTSVQNAAGAVQLWPHLSTRDIAWPTLLRCLGLPLGVYALDATRGVDQGLVKQILGGILLLAVTLLAGLRVRPRDHLHAGWGLLAFLSSGFLQGFASIGGAPMVLYVNSLSWSAPKSRGFLFACSAALMPVMAVMLAWKLGRLALQPALAALVVMPPVLAGLWAGLKLGHRMDKDLFRKLTYALLLMVALAAILTPVMVNRP